MLGGVGDGGVCVTSGYSVVERLVGDFVNSSLVFVLMIRDSSDNP